MIYFPMLKKLDRSIWVLIGANIIPLIGVLFWGWSTFEVVALYWLENVIIGGINILKMITCSPDRGLVESMMEQKIAERGGKLSAADQEKVEQAREMFDQFGDKAGILNHGIKLFMVPFFAVHYGGFCVGHGLFVFLLLGGNKEMMGGGIGIDQLSELITEAVSTGGVWAALALVISHLFSFFTNYLGKRENRRTVVPILMFAPYGRIVVLHIAIIFGAFAIMALGSPVFLLVLLITGKTLLDIKLHIRSHRKFQGTNQPKATGGIPPMA